MNSILRTSIRFTLSLSTALLFSCSRQNQSSSSVFYANTSGTNSIIGGQAVDSNFQKENGIVGLLIVSEMPSVDPQGPPRNSEAICTGSLISKRIVLTAAHCLYNTQIKAVLVVFETNIKEAVMQKRYIEASKASPSELFKPTGKGGAFVEGEPWNDIGIIELSADAPSDFSFAKLPNAADSAKLSPRTQLTLAGYGVTDPTVNDIKKLKGKQVVIPIAGEAETAGTLRSVSDISVLQSTKDNKEILLDQQNGTRGACHGDSGGPAFIKNPDGTYTLIGITSRGTDLTGNCDKQNVFTNVFGQMDWIKAKAAL